MPRPTPNDPDRGEPAPGRRTGAAGEPTGREDPERAFAMMEEDDRDDRREGLLPDDSSESSSRSSSGSSSGDTSGDTSFASDFPSSNETPSSDFGAPPTPIGESGPIDTVDEPDTAGGGTAGVASEVLRAQAGEGAGTESLPDPHASSARQGSLVAPPTPDRRFRPQLRPPTPVLEVLDDDLQGSESIRLRRRTFTLGRVQGDLTLPNDRVMSRRHAEVFLDTDKAAGTTRWMLRDLKSVNGSFLRVQAVKLADRDRLWMGGDLIRAGINKRTGELTLIELKNQDADRVTLRPGRHWVGVGTGCVGFLQASPFLDDRAFRVESDAAGRWTLTDNGSTNGLWRAIEGEPVELTDGSQFKLGEQHFVFRLP